MPSFEKHSIDKLCIREFADDAGKGLRYAMEEAFELLTEEEVAEFTFNNTDNMRLARLLLLVIAAHEIEYRFDIGRLGYEKKKLRRILNKHKRKG